MRIPEGVYWRDGSMPSCAEAIYVPAGSVEPYFPEEDCQFVCTRPRGHSGPHVDEGAEWTWGDDDE